MLNTSRIPDRPASQFLQLDDATIHFHDLGSGSERPVMLIHGAGPGASGWVNYLHNAAALAQSRRVLVLDLPGFGKSRKPSLSGGLYGAYARILLAFIEKLRIETVDVVGNSLGGGIAMKMAMLEPSRVGRLVLMGPAGVPSMMSAQPSAGIRNLLEYYAGSGPSREKLEASLRLMVFDQTLLTTNLLEERYQTSIEPEIVANWPIGPGKPPPLEAIWREDLASIANETLVLWGRDDRVNTFDMFPLLLSQLQNSQLTVFARCGHWVQIERPNAFNTLVDLFLKGGLVR